MESGVYLSSEKVDIWFLRWIGFLLSWRFPVHTKLFVKLVCSGYCFKLELTSDKPTKQTRTVGEGDGYTIQITRVEEKDIQGQLVPNCDPLEAMVAAEEYASVRNGNYNYYSVERSWYDEPQGCGGPMFDRCTCNTFTSYVLKKSLISGEIPPKPAGALGWGQTPKFPGPSL